MHLAFVDSYLNTVTSFTSLEAHANVLRAEALAQSAPPPVKPKDANKGAVSEEQGGKKRKGVKSSTGVEKLKKANTTGMAKLSTFFTKS